MSVGHLQDEAKPVADVYGMLGTGDAPKLYAQDYKVDTSHDIPYGAGISVDRGTVYIDRTLYRDVMAGKCSFDDMPPKLLIQAWIEHERVEAVIIQADNPVDVYTGAHEYANGKENRFIEQATGKRGNGIINAYHKATDPAINACIPRFIELGSDAKPPKDYWCGPILDHPTADDRKLIAILKAKGVPDAFKASKYDAHYGIGGEECRECVHYNPSEPAMGLCDKVSGLVRADRHCDWWKVATDSD